MVSTILICVGALVAAVGLIGLLSRAFKRRRVSAPADKAA